MKYMWLILPFIIALGAADDKEIWPVPTECPKVNPLDYTVHLRHESNCSQFYKCDHGNRVLFNCSDTLHFNPVLQVCDWPANANCLFWQTSTTTTTTSTPVPIPPVDRDADCPWPDPLDHTVHLPHETDCTKFYKCDNGKKVIFDCPDGLHFNEELEVCDWPDKAGCANVKPTPNPTSAPTTTKKPTTTSTTTAAPKPPADRDPECPWPDPLNYTVHLPHETDCTKFYKCDNGKKVIFDCPDGLHFNEELEVCDWPDKAGCANVKPTANPTSAPTTTAKPTTTSTTTAAPKPPADKDPECPWPDPLNYTVHLPHETDCTKFYKCDNGKKVIFDCPDGLHFNEELEVCDWPDKAGCASVKPTPNPTSAPTTTKKPTTTSTTTAAPKPPADRDPECPWPDPLNYTVHLPHETDCTKFYKCDNGKKVIFDCPDGLHFNEELEVCDWPDKAGCASVKPTPNPTSAPTTTKKPTTTSTTTAAPKPPADRDPECPWPDPLNYTVHLPHETDCTKFYKCDNGKKVIFDCPDGLHFNEELEVCDWPDKAGCANVKPTANPTSAPTTTTKPTTTRTTTAAPKPPADKDPECPWPDPLNYTVHLPHETDCTKFYKCDNGKKVIFDCPDGLHFNEELEVCDWPDKAGCASVKPTPNPTSAPTTTKKPTTTSTTTAAPKPPADRDPECPWPDPLNYTVHLPHETDCTKFYKCDNGKKVIFDCPDGLHFNEELEVCDWPDKAGCANVKPTANPTSAPTTTAKPTTTSTTTAAPKPPADKDPECPWPDPLNYTVHLPHETDCTKFYKCDNGKKVIFDCPDGLHFNEELEVCDWPDKAGCASVKPTPNPTSAPTTTKKPTTTSTTTAAPKPPADRDPECPWPDPLNYTVHLPHETDCTKFYKCDNGKKVIFDCPDGLHFNEELEVCDWPDKAGCASVKPTPNPTSAPTTTKKPTTTSTTTAAPKPPADRDPECPWPDPLNYTVHLPHETDCTKFYKCDNGKKVIFDCPDGLHFNEELEVCDWPDKAGCANVKPTANPTSAPTTTTKPTTTSTTTAAPKPPADKDPECPWPDPLNYTVHLPHETDCTKFYKCDNGKKVIFDCPDGLHFNEELEVCDWPDKAGCANVKPTANPTSAPTTTTKPTTTSTTTAAPKPPADKDPECPWPDPLNYTVHLPHETDCTKFYKCDNGKKVIFDCPDGLHFNEELEVCDWPDKAGCANVKPTANPTSAPTTTTKPTTTRTTTAAPKPPADRDPECPWPDPLNYTVHLPHETDCTKFYKCDNGKKVIFDCPDGLHFNEELEVCDWPDKAGCANVKPTPNPTSAPTTTKVTTTAVPTPPADKSPDCPWPDPLNYTVHLPHECDCDKFYICDNGKKVVLDCPEGLHFNKELEICDYPEKAGCTNVTISTTTSTTTTFTTTTTPTTTTMPTTTIVSTTTTGVPTPPADRDPECPWPDPLNYTVHLPHETDCDKFYKCDNGKKVSFDCPDGLHFNKELEVCDYPQSAGCIIPTTLKPTKPGVKDECEDGDISRNYCECSRYFVCEDGNKVAYHCEDGLYFNENIGECDLPENVDCIQM